MPLSIQEHEMAYKNIILDSLKESFYLIWKNKRWFVLLFVLEILFLIALSAVNYHYQIEIVGHSKAISDYISKLQLDEAAVADSLMQQKSILGDDPLLISRKSNEILRNFRLMLASILALMLVFLSTSWAITARAAYKINLKNFIKFSVQVFFVLMFYLGIIFLFFYYLVNISLLQIAFNPYMLGLKYALFLAVLILSLYFMFISLSLVHKTGIRNIAQKTLVIGIRKAHYALGAYAVNAFFLAVPAVIFFSFEKSMLALFSSTMLLVFSLVFGRFFMLKTFEKIS